MSPPSPTARCAQHPDVPALEVCGRCGGFLCADCKIQFGAKVLCSACYARNETKSSPLPVVPIGLAMAWPFVLGEMNLNGGWGTVVASVSAPVLAIPAVAMAFLELRRRRGAKSSHRGGWLLVTALVVGLIEVGLGVRITTRFLSQTTEYRESHRSASP